MKADNPREILPIVDEAGHQIGSASRETCHNGIDRPLHPVVHIHLFNTEGMLYLQKRPEWKDIQPGKWDTAVGGHIDCGETVEQALNRELSEELGLTGLQFTLLRNYVFESARERELIYAFRAVTSLEPAPSDELDGGRFWTRQEIRDNIGKGIFTPNFESEYTLLFEDSEHLA